MAGCFTGLALHGGLPLLIDGRRHVLRIAHLHIMAVAQKEASAISTRTRDALAAKKARGAQLGTPANLTQAAREKSWAAMPQNAQANINNSISLVTAPGMAKRFTPWV